MLLRHIPGPLITITQTLAGAVLAISIGVIAQWFLYAELSASVRALVGIAPFALAIISFMLFPSLFWFRRGAPIGGIALFTILGLVPTVVGSVILLIRVACNFGECVNL